MKFEELFQRTPCSVTGEMRKAIEGLNEEIEKLRRHLEQLEKLESENALLRKDKERLDWMQEVKLTVLHHAGKVYGRGAKSPCTRAAIDAARKEAQP